MKHWLILLALLIAQFVHLPAQANLLPPRVTNYTSSSLVTADPPGKFRVDTTSLIIKCRYTCTVEAEYTISSKQSTETLLLFVLPEHVNVHATVNNATVPVSGTSGLKGFPLQREKSLLTMNFLLLDLEQSAQSEPLFYTSFNAPFSAGVNIIRIQYEQPYNYGISTTRRTNNIRHLHYEIWPLKDWYLTDSFTMSISAEFSKTRPEDEEVLVQYIDEFPQKSTPPAMELFTSSTPTITFKKQWGKNFPGRIKWFIGNKKSIENAQEIGWKK